MPFKLVLTCSPFDKLPAMAISNTVGVGESSKLDRNIFDQTPDGYEE
jgi:hypothetical protein